MSKAKGVKRRKITAGESMIKSRMSFQKDATFYAVIEQLSLEIRFQIFFHLFRCTHSVDEITELVDPSWFNETDIKAPPNSLILDLLILLFQRTDATVYDDRILIGNFREGHIKEGSFTLLDYLESFPPNTFKLEIRSSWSKFKRSKQAARCFQLATEIASQIWPDIIDYLRIEGVLPKVTKVILQYYHFFYPYDEWYKWYILDIGDKTDGKRTLEFFNCLRDIINSFSSTNSLNDDRGLYYVSKELAGFFDKRNINLCMNVSSFPDLNRCRFLLSHLARIEVLDKSLRDVESLENLLKQCTSLQKLGITGSKLSQNCKMIFQSDSIHEINIRGIAFDFSGFPNLKM
ncbi:unnamed protein product [Ambrosiozyma monospora]|uniref:Unnamed protein product n=1 Tax=Ambrosiozyma monospora TaxID=43982 RepID=A0ACB5T204_AMBMO|nr:unnamed protein product [Ambrosiozyma monospora]